MKILISYDPPHPDTMLLDRALVSAKNTDAYVYIVNSIFDGKDAAPEKVEKTEKELADAKAVFDAEDISAETHILIRQKTPGEDIVAFAEENGIDEIFIQIKKTSKVGKLIKGSNAQHILLNAPCTVVSVR